MGGIVQPPPPQKKGGDIGRVSSLPPPSPTENPPPPRGPKPNSNTWHPRSEKKPLYDIFSVTPRCLFPVVSSSGGGRGDVGGEGEGGM